MSESNPPDNRPPGERPTLGPRREERPAGERPTLGPRREPAERPTLGPRREPGSGGPGGPGGPGGRGRRDDRPRGPMTVKGRLRAKARKKARRAQKKKGGFVRKKLCRFCAEKGKPEIDYKDPKNLRYFVTETGKLIPQRISGNCAKHQRAVALAIKRARQLALMPYTGHQGQ